MKAKSSCSDTFLIMYLREKGKKEVFTCMLLVFLPIFAPNKFPLLKK